MPADDDDGTGRPRQFLGTLAERLVQRASLERRLQFGEAGVHLRGGGLELTQHLRGGVAQPALGVSGDGAEHQMRRMDALLGGVVQLPGDTPALGLDGQPLGSAALDAQRRTASAAYAIPKQTMTGSTR